jgi:polyphosphate kinase 2 (PPK2 family)
MEGVVRAREGEIENAVLGAWYGERFARIKKLQRLSVYLAELKPKKPQTGAEVLAIMQGFAAAGVPITIRKIGKDAKDGGQ